jgi:hypothetical protein
MLQEIFHEQARTCHRSANLTQDTAIQTAWFPIFALMTLPNESLALIG